MAFCSTCNKDVGCSCKLIGGQCLSCIQVNSNPPTINQINYNPGNNFIDIVNSGYLTKDEKLRKINEILENNNQ